MENVSLMLLGFLTMMLVLKSGDGRFSVTNSVETVLNNEEHPNRHHHHNHHHHRHHNCKDKVAVDCLSDEDCDPFGQKNINFKCKDSEACIAKCNSFGGVFGCSTTTGDDQAGRKYCICQTNR